MLRGGVAAPTLLMLAPSCSLAPLFLVAEALSEPARSMSESLAARRSEAVRHAERGRKRMDGRHGPVVLFTGRFWPRRTTLWRRVRLRVCGAFSSSGSSCTTATWRTAWEREETVLAAVDSMRRRVLPSLTMVSTASASDTSRSVSPDTATSPEEPTSHGFSARCSSCPHSRSYTCSL